MSRTRGERQSAERAGRRAERWASLYLRAKGYQILAQRFKTRDGEIDIAAKRGRHMVFIEVKQRQTLDAALKSIGYESCLLYTSPSPRDATLSRMPSSA